MNDKRPSLGVVTIAYNEEEDLPGFLDHLLLWIDEIIIIDDGSTDQSSAIAEGAGEKVRYIKSPRVEGEYYADQRNKGIALAKSDWLLHLDIDERVPSKLAIEIIEAISNDNKKAYRYRRKNYFLHQAMKGGGWADWNLVHLAKREVLSFGGMFHESIHLTVSNDQVGQLNHAIWHINDQDYNERIRKSNGYLKEMSDRIVKENFKIRWFHLVWAPVREFLYKFFYKKGYKDKTLGVLWALHAASAKFRAYALVWDQQNGIARSELEQQIKDDWQKADLSTLKRK